MDKLTKEQFDARINRFVVVPGFVSVDGKQESCILLTVIDIDEVCLVSGEKFYECRKDKGIYIVFTDNMNFDRIGYMTFERETMQDQVDKLYQQYLSQ